jgi:hypothetical protein
LNRAEKNAPVVLIYTISSKNSSAPGTDPDFKRQQYRKNGVRN